MTKNDHFWDFIISVQQYHIKLKNLTKFLTRYKTNNFYAT